MFRMEKGPRLVSLGTVRNLPIHMALRETRDTSELVVIAVKPPFEKLKHAQDKVNV